MGEAGDAGLHEGADVVVRHLLGELRVVLDHVGPRPGHAHVALEHVDELRQFVNAEPAHPAPEAEDPHVALHRLAGLVGVVFTHRAELDDLEFTVLDSRALLQEEERAGRLESLHDPDHEHERREDEKDDGQCDREIQRALGEAVHGVFQRLLAQRDEAHPLVLDMHDGVIQQLLKIAQDEQADSHFLEHPDDIPVQLALLRKLEDDDLCDFFAPDDGLQIGDPAEARQAVEFRAVRFIGAQNADGAQAVCLLVAQPFADAPGMFGLADEEGALDPFSVENPPREDARQPVVRQEQPAIKAHGENREEPARDGLVLGPGKIDEQRSEREDDLPHGDAVLGEKTVLPEVHPDTRAVTAHGLEEHADHDGERVHRIMCDERALNAGDRGEHHQPRQEQDQRHQQELAQEQGAL